MDDPKIVVSNNGTCPAETPEQQPKRSVKSTATDNVLNLADFTLPQDFDKQTGAKPVWVPGSIKVQTPSREWWVRTRPDWIHKATCLELKGSEIRGEIYLVHGLIVDLVDDATVSTRVLFGAVNRDRKPFLWPVRLTGSKGKKLDPWNKVAYETAIRAQDQWMRLSAGDGTYNVQEAVVDMGEPVWPNLSFEELVTIAFDGRIIRDLDDPVLKTLKGLM